MKIPLEKRLRKQAHRRVAALQDEVLEILYALHSRFILHGGTAIWRCFGGGRFSEDLDLYATALPEDFEARLRSVLSSRGLQLKKIKKTANLVFCKVSGPETEIRVEINFAKTAPGTAMPYEKMEGASMIVFTLSSGMMIAEKARAYLSRKLIRDMYDVYFLAGQLEGQTEAREAIREMLKNCPTPLDEENLKSIVYSGAVPSFQQMVQYLKGRFA